MHHKKNRKSLDRTIILLPTNFVPQLAEKLKSLNLTVRLRSTESLVKSRLYCNVMKPETCDPASRMALSFHGDCTWQKIEIGSSRLYCQSHFFRSSEIKVAIATAVLKALSVPSVMATAQWQTAQRASSSSLLQRVQKELQNTSLTLMRRRETNNDP